MAAGPLAVGPMAAGHPTGEEPAAVFLSGEHARAALGLAPEAILIGVEGETAYFAADLSAHDPPPLPPFERPAAFADLREVGPLIGAGEGALLALARGMAHWHRNHRFCGRCGSPTTSRDAGFVRRCTLATCAREHYPRTDPAVIMLIAHEDGRALLGRQASWPQGRYSTLAGFVEPGETLEAAVRREVHEETGVRVTEVIYERSQPWPFPASLMLGFRGLAADDAIRLNDGELDDARWFTRDEVRAFYAQGLMLPRSGSISRWLIARWLAEDGGPVGI